MNLQGQLVLSMPLHYQSGHTVNHPEQFAGLLPDARPGARQCRWATRSRPRWWGTATAAAVRPALWGGRAPWRDAEGGLMSGTMRGTTSGTMTNPADEPLKRFGLTSLARSLPDVLEQARQQQWPDQTFLQQALVAEGAGCAERAYQWRLRAAHLPASKSLESFHLAFQPSVSQRLLEELGTLSFVQTATNVVFLGPPRLGKIHLASELVARTLQGGYSVLFTTLR